MIVSHNKWLSFTYPQAMGTWRDAVSFSPFPCTVCVNSSSVILWVVFCNTPRCSWVIDSLKHFLGFRYARQAVFIANQRKHKCRQNFGNLFLDRNVIQINSVVVVYAVLNTRESFVTVKSFWWRVIVCRVTFCWGIFLSSLNHITVKLEAIKAEFKFQPSSAWILCVFHSLLLLKKTRSIMKSAQFTRILTTPSSKYFLYLRTTWLASFFRIPLPSVMWTRALIKATTTTTNNILAFKRKSNSYKHNWYLCEGWTVVIEESFSIMERIWLQRKVTPDKSEV